MLYSSSGEPQGLIFNIQEYTIHDGPGIRTELFFKGCPLRCKWCSNPEGIVATAQLGVRPDKCLSLEKCGYCLKGCPLQENSPIKHDQNGVLSAVNMVEVCKDCLKCADICPSRAITLWGKRYTVPELMKIILNYRNFYLKSGGGVTLSGGEVMLQWEFASLLLKECKKNSIHTCVESALHCPTEHMEAVYENTDLVITDIKHMNSAKHKQFTGVGNELILKNIRRTVELNKPLVIRTPVVADYNNDEENIRAIGAFLRDELGGRILQYQLSPYRKLGTEKYKTLGIPYPMGYYVPPERQVWEANIRELVSILRTEFGLPAVPGANYKLPV